MTGRARLVLLFLYFTPRANYKAKFFLVKKVSYRRRKIQFSYSQRKFLIFALLINHLKMNRLPKKAKIFLGVIYISWKITQFRHLDLRRFHLDDPTTWDVSNLGYIHLQVGYTLQILFYKKNENFPTIKFYSDTKTYLRAMVAAIWIHLTIKRIFAKYQNERSTYEESESKEMPTPRTDVQSKGGQEEERVEEKSWKRPNQVLSSVFDSINSLFGTNNFFSSL